MFARSWILLAGVIAATAAQAQVAGKAAGDMSRYTSKAWRWSVSYPAGWTVDSRAPDLVRIRSAGQNALCSFNSGALDRFNNVDEFTDFMLGNDGQFFKERNQRFAVLARRRIVLPNGIAGSEALVEISGSIRSRRIYALADGRGFAIDCEAATQNWDKLDAAYQRVIASFTVSK